MKIEDWTVMEQHGEGRKRNIIYVYAKCKHCWHEIYFGYHCTKERPELPVCKCRKDGE